MSWTITAADDIDADGPGSATTGFVSAAFPVNGVLDNFNRADGGLGSNWTDTWEPGSSGWSVVSNKAQPTISANSTAYWNVSNFGGNCEVYCKVSSVSISYIQLAARLVSEGSAGVDGYLLSTNGSNLEVYKIENAGFTLLGATISQTVTNGDSIGMSLSGGTITVYYKSGAGAWTSMGTRDGSAFTAAGKIGLRAGSTADAIDDFGGGTI